MFSHDAILPFSTEDQSEQEVAETLQRLRVNNRF
jgi:hypothetical protein